MAEGAIVVPLYSRQAPAELAGMMRNCQPALIFVSDAALGESVAQAWPDAPRRVLFDESLRQSAPQIPLADAPDPRPDSDVVTIIYTSERRRAEGGLPDRRKTSRTCFPARPNASIN